MREQSCLTAYYACSTRCDMRVPTGRCHSGHSAPSNRAGRRTPTQAHHNSSTTGRYFPATVSLGPSGAILSLLHSQPTGPQSAWRCCTVRAAASTAPFAAATTVTTPSVGASRDVNARLLSEQQLQTLIQSQVVQVRTLHRVPSPTRPWESGSGVQSSCSAFVLDPTRRLLVTTAGAVEAVRRVMVSRADDSDEVMAHVVAVCLDADVALLRVGRAPSSHDRRAASGHVDDRHRKGGTRQQGRAQGTHSSNSRPAEYHLQAQDEEEEGEEAGEEAGEEEGEEEEEEAVRVRAGARGRRPGRSGGLSKEERFWRGLTPVRWGPLPLLQDSVRVAGYPIGGDSLAVTSGVVSRCEVVEYSHSNRNLLALQVDAPLNNGVWGGPVYDGCGRVLGMAFQKNSSQMWMERYDEEGLDALGPEEGGQGDGDGPDGEGEGGGGGGHMGDAEDDSGENVGYCVPSLLLEHVLEDWERLSRGDHMTDVQSANELDEEESSPFTSTDPMPGGSDVSPVVLEGLPVLGLRWQGLESPALRTHLGMQPHESGVRIAAVDPSASSAGVLMPGDVLTRLGAHAIANDGTILLRPAQRVLFGHAVACRHVGEALPASVIRQGERLQLQLRLVHSSALIPTAMGTSRALYLILGGAVILQMTLPFLYSREMPRAKGRRLKGWSFGHLGVSAALEWGLPTEAGGQEVLVCSELLDGSVADEGYGPELGGNIRCLNTVDGVRVLNMAHLVSLVLAGGNIIGGSHSAEQDKYGSSDAEPNVSGRRPSTSKQRQSRSGALSAPTRATLRLGSSEDQDQERDDRVGDVDDQQEIAQEHEQEKGQKGTEQEQGQGFLRLGFSDGSLMVFDRATLRRDTQAALAQQGIAHAMSARLRALLPPEAKQWPADPGSRPGPAVQKRQQRRRLAIRR